ncbi:hypothetical protein DSAG12_01331 [Promethearchaeum syntrophicum]|uniref:Uncharacterized protein n=1 Tax=Promethearchaeum syntrophicum TaxID=2594042 RepID=A0A5B9D921_9ARCH|nr:hypothetical protein [Candidatus Prometheoarchaeum syntrophicum]QEE15505.1 hypothetical protein DSAG12_01331 [Candidatus Prometheoarchaeum syntrophicum]
MKKIPRIQEIWIIAKNGLHIASSKIKIDKKEIEIDEDMFSGFIAAINVFTFEIGLNKCRVLETKSSKLCFSHYSDLDLTFVAKSTKNIDNSEILSYLEIIKSKIVQKYKKIIKNWEGSVSDFKGISKYIDIEKDKKNWI